MATTYLEALPPSKTHGTHRRIRWTPETAQLEISQGKTGRDSVTYTLTEFYASPGYGAGRAFSLTRPDGERYDLFVGVDCVHTTCGCKGFAYGNGWPCKHIDAVQALMDNNWLPDPRCNGEQDTGATETTEQEPEYTEAAGHRATRFGGTTPDLEAF